MNKVEKVLTALIGTALCILVVLAGISLLIWLGDTYGNGAPMILTLWIGVSALVYNNLN